MCLSAGYTYTFKVKSFYQHNKIYKNNSEFGHHLENGGHLEFVQFGSITNFKDCHLIKLSAYLSAFVINRGIILIIATNLLQ